MTYPRSNNKFVHKFGHNDDSDTGDDVWDGSAPYTWLSAAGTVSYESSSAADTSAGTGARTATFHGLDGNYAEQTETVTLNGTTPVDSTKTWLRMFRGIVDTAGSGDVNAGAVKAAQGTTTLAQINADRGQTLMCIYTVPAGSRGFLTYWDATSNGNTAAELVLQMRPQGGAWNTKEIAHLDQSANSFYHRNFSDAVSYPIEPKTDIRVRVSSGLNLMSTAATFDIFYY